MAARRAADGMPPLLHPHMNKTFFTVVAAALVGLSCCTYQQTEPTPSDGDQTGTSTTPPQQTGTKPHRGGKTGSSAGQAKPVRSVPAFPGRRISRVSVPGKYVALTFDDGPHATLTPRILDILARHNAKGTFFVLGQRAAQHPEILARAVSQGCEIGSHTWNHINFARSSREKIHQELDRTAAVIRSATGSAPRVIRPPYGAGSGSVINDIYATYGTPSILWDVDTNDWRKPGVQTVINRAVNGARPGSIILVHDIHSSTADAIEGIVTGLQSKGYTLVTVSELIDMGRRWALASGKQPPAPAAPAATSTPAPSQPVVVPGQSAQPAAPVTPAAPASGVVQPAVVQPVQPSAPAASSAPAAPTVSLQPSAINVAPQPASPVLLPDFPAAS